MPKALEFGRGYCVASEGRDNLCDVRERPSGEIRKEVTVTLLSLQYGGS